MLSPLRKRSVIIMRMTHKLQINATGSIFIVETKFSDIVLNTVTIINKN